MGEIADGLINGDFDFYTGEYIGRGYGIPRTGDRSLPWESRRESKRVKKIRKELALLIKEKQQSCTTQAQKNHAVNEARREINLKYGQGWRNQ